MQNAYCPRWFIEAPARGEMLEDCIEAAYRAIVKPGDMAVDGGAHLGRHSLKLAELTGPSGRVLAFEPIPHLARHLEDVCARSGIQQHLVFENALAHVVKQLSFTHVVDAPGYSGLRERDRPDDATHVETLKVMTCRLDDILPESGVTSLRFIKLDLEGGEYDALRGATETMRAKNPVIIFENGRQRMADLYGYTPEDWFALFEGVGYDLYDLFGNPFTLERWSASPLPWYILTGPRGSEDLAAALAAARYAAEQLD